MATGAHGLAPALDLEAPTSGIDDYNDAISEMKEEDKKADGQKYITRNLKMGFEAAGVPALVLENSYLNNSAAKNYWKREIEKKFDRLYPEVPENWRNRRVKELQSEVPGRRIGFGFSGLDDLFSRTDPEDPPLTEWSRSSYYVGGYDIETHRKVAHALVDSEIRDSLEEVRENTLDFLPDM